MAGQRFRIMIVDDEEDMRALLSMCLGEKYEVFTATNGLDAMLKLPRYEPDLVLLDIMMPLMDGHEVAKKIRTTAGFEEMPIIMLSALNSNEDIKHGYSAGANLYLTKPFQPERVMRNVAMSLENLSPRSKKMSIADVEEHERRHEQKKRAALMKKGLETPVEREERPAASSPMMPRGAQGQPTPRSAVVTPPEGPRRPTTESSSEEHSRPDGLARPRVMLIDDDDDFLLLARTALEEEFEVMIAENGFDALEKVPETEPDIYVIDGMMPRMSGFQLIDILRSSMGTAFKPILFVSARCTERDKRMVASKGVDNYLEKPFSPSQLLAKLYQMTADESFIVAPKKVSIRDLLYAEGHRRAAAKQTDDRRKRWESGKEIKSFLANELKGGKKK